MAGLAMLIVYTVLVGLLELRFDFTVGEVLRHLIELLVGSR